LHAPLVKTIKSSAKAITLVWLLNFKFKSELYITFQKPGFVIAIVTQNMSLKRQIFLQVKIINVAYFINYFVRKCSEV
jgi:hypothetical protein